MGSLRTSAGIDRILPSSGFRHLHGRRTINEGNRRWRAWCAGLYADGATTGRVMVRPLHPWSRGQPWRLRPRDAGLGHITAPAGGWQATGRESLDGCTAQAGEPGRLAVADAGTPRAGERSRPRARPPGRLADAPITARPGSRWPGNARVAFRVAPTLACFEYRPESRPTPPDLPP